MRITNRDLEKFDFEYIDFLRLRSIILIIEDLAI